MESSATTNTTRLIEEYLGLTSPVTRAGISLPSSGSRRRLPSSQYVTTTLELESGEESVQNLGVDAFQIPRDVVRPRYSVATRLPQAQHGQAPAWPAAWLDSTRPWKKERTNPIRPIVHQTLYPYPLTYPGVAAVGGGRSLTG